MRYCVQLVVVIGIIVTLYLRASGLHLATITARADAVPRDVTYTVEDGQLVAVGEGGERYVGAALVGARLSVRDERGVTTLVRIDAAASIDAVTEAIMQRCLEAGL